MRNLKRALSLAMASVMLLGLMVVGTGASYSDVDSQDNLEAIEVLKMVGIMTGDDKGNFNPDQKVTRNEMAVVMVNLLGLKTGGTSPFTDVPAWAQPYVAACYNNGIIAGISATQFGGSSDVTAVQAGLMIMKALGYFGYQGEFADDWKLATVKQANKIDLYDGISAYTDQSMTRNEVAQMVLNALECTIQVVTEQGGLSVDGNGVTVVVNPTYTYENAVNNSGKDYLSRSNEKTMQLCEKLYNNNLKKVENYAAGDDFGRPSTKWTYGNDNIITPNQPDLTYTKEVKGKDIYTDLGKITPDNITYIRNNKTETTNYVNDGAGVLAITSGDNEKIGGKGTLIEVYYDNDDLSNTTATVVVVDTYLAKATEDFDVDDEEVDVNIYDATTTSATLSSDDFAVSGVQEDDYLLVNLSYDGSSDYEVKAVSFPTVVENATVSSARADDYVVADGTKYEYSAVAKAASSGALGQSLMAGTSYSINDDGYNLYLDSYGYVVGVEGYDAGVNLDDYVFVKQVSTNGFDVIVKALFMDGTTKTVVVDKIGSTDVTLTNQINSNEFYKFDTDKDGNYELTTIDTGAAGTVVKQNSVTSKITSAANPLADVSAPSGTSETVFIAKDKTFTGVKNAPEVASGAVYYLTNDKGRLMVVYTAQTGSSKTSSDDLVYILNNNPAKAKDGDDTYYIYNAIVKGEKTTLDANQNSKPAGVYKLDTYTDGRADLGSALAPGADALVNILGMISTADYEDGTLTLGSNGYLLADDAKIFTIDGNTVKAISASGVKKAVTTDNFKYAAAIEVSSSNADIVTVYLSKTSFGAPAPTITVQPTASTSVVVGSISGSLSVTATTPNSGALTYQWKQDGVNVAGATTNSLTIPTTLTAGTYNFTCVVTNTKDGGSNSVTTNAAVVNVAPAAPVYTAGTAEGDVSDETITITNAGGSEFAAGTYTLYLASAPTVALDTVTLSSAGTTLSFTGITGLTTGATDFQISVTVNGQTSANSANISITPAA